MPQRQVSTTHSISTFTVSRERQKPASSMVKPTCMPNTRKAATSVQAVLRGFTTSAASTSDAVGAAGAPGAVGAAGATTPVGAVAATGAGGAEEAPGVSAAGGLSARAG